MLVGYCQFVNRGVALTSQQRYDYCRIFALLDGAEIELGGIRISRPPERWVSDHKILPAVSDISTKNNNSLSMAKDVRFGFPRLMSPRGSGSFDCSISINSK